MKHRHARRAIAALATSTILIGLSQTAIGQQGAANISGPWRFQSGTFDGDCKMSGGISLKPAAAAGSYACSMIVETHCRNGDDGLYEYWRVKEICTAKLTGQRVQITGKIERVEEASMLGEKLTGGDLSTYVPDSFELTIRPGAAEMNGHMVDRLRRVSARVWREAELVS